MVRITFAVAMIMVALSSNPFIHKKAAAPAPVATQVVKPAAVVVPQTVVHQTAAPQHTARPVQPRDAGTATHPRRRQPLASLVRGM